MSFSSNQIIFLINPNSGRGSYSEVLSSLKKNDCSIQYHINKNKTDLESFFSTLSEQFKVVVICGGDGTVNSVLKYALNSDLVFAVLPTGSGNGFAREMGYTKKISSLLKAIKKGEIGKIDVLKINDNYFCNMAGIGFDAFIAKKFDKSGKRGLISYAKQTLKGFFEFEHFNATIKTDDIQRTGNYFMLSIANTRQFGNNVIIAPQAMPDDGFMDLVVVKSFSKILIPIIALKLLAKKSKNSKYIQHLRMKRLTISSNYNYYHVDGESIINSNSKLNVCIGGTMNIINAK